MDESILFHGANGDALLGIIDDGVMRPGDDGKIFFSKYSFDRVFGHGGDRRRKASFAVKLRVQIPERANTYLQATAGVPDTLIVETWQPVPVEVLALFVRRPAPDGGFDLTTVQGVSEIRSYLRSV